MIKMRNIFHRLDIQLSIVVGSIVLLWFISFLLSARMINQERLNKNTFLERERIQLRINAESTQILNDLILDHYRALELNFQELYHSLGLAWIELRSKGKIILRYGNVPTDSTHYLLEQTYPIQFDGTEYATISIGKELWIMNRGEAIPKRWVFGIALAMISIFFMIRLFIQKQIINPLNQLIRYFGESSPHDLQPSKSRTVEIDGLIRNFHEMRNKLLAYQDRFIETEKQAALGDLASQVAHDIRSPLTALSVVNEDLSELPENKRVLVRSAVNRINDIANNLLDRKKEAEKTAALLSNHEEATIQLLTPIIESLTSEKRLQFSSRIGVQILTDFNEKSYGLFARIQTGAFKRILSNLINNAVESLNSEGTVLIGLYSSHGAIRLTVTDNGRGIPPEIQPTLFQRGVSFNKKGGMGLGLYSARERLQDWGARISIESTLGLGTTVNLFIPQAPTPKWFISKLQVRPDAVVGILDDDSSIHLTWKRRFESVAGKTQQLIHFSTPEELASWIKNSNNLASLFLVDYELREHTFNGLDVVESLKIQDRSVLVTSHSDEKMILDRCENLNVRLLPKSMANIVPIEVAAGNT